MRDGVYKIGDSRERNDKYNQAGNMEGTLP